MLDEEECQFMRTLGLLILMFVVGFAMAALVELHEPLCRRFELVKWLVDCCTSLIKMIRVIVIDAH